MPSSRKCFQPKILRTWRRCDVEGRRWRGLAACVVHVFPCLLLSALAVACRPVTRAPSPSEPAASQAAGGSTSADAGGELPPSQPRQSPPATRETWDVLYIDDTRIGYAFTRYESSEEEGQSLLRITSQHEMTVARFGQRVTQRVTLDSWETPRGELRRFRSQINDGAANITSQGRAQDEKLVIELATRGESQTTSIPWNRSWGGFFATEQRLEQQPMKPGETRSFQALMPLFNQVAQVRLEAVDYEPTKLLTQQKELLRIRSSVQFGGSAIESVMWTDRQGETWKTLLPAMNQVTYRATKEVALQSKPTDGQFDLGWKSVVKVQRPLADPHQTQRITYRVHLASGDPASAFAAGSTQRVERIDSHTAKITVRAIRPGSAAEGFPADAPPGDAELASSSFLQSDDERIVSMARSAVPDESDPWRVACALERTVRDAVQTKDFTQALATAADVARSLEGDCTEHAVLLAALCRARKIPARVAIGLVYYARVSGFAYHMWSEVWIRGHWIPIDGTLGLGGIGAAHLKINHSNLDGTDSLSAFLPVFELLGQLQLEVADVQPAEEPREAAR